MLEGIPRELAALVTRSVDVPTIGIGAGPDCDGQVLVVHDLLGLTEGAAPKFVRRFGSLLDDGAAAVGRYCDAVREGSFPSDGESYHVPGALRSELVERFHS